MILLWFYFFLAVIKLLSFLPVHRDWIWTLHLLVSEMGHFVSFGVFVVLVVDFFLYRKKELYKLRLLLGLVSSLLFLMPTLQAVALKSHYTQRLEEAFKGAHKDFDFSFAALLKVKSSEISFFDNFPYEPKEIEFTKRKRRALKILNYSIESDSKNKPWVLVIHGGGWDSGTPRQLSPLNYEMASWGFSVFASEYRLSGESRWPAQQEDILEAIGWIQKNSAALNVDPYKGFLLGRSAGGQLALSACYSKKVKGIKGCVAFYAPTDMEIAYKVSSPDDFFKPIPRISAFLGGSPSEKPQEYAQSSPLRFVDSETPATLLIHGTPDFWVWVGHGYSLMKKLRANKVRATLIEIPWANHGFDVNLNGPAGQISTQSVKWFLTNESKN